MTPAHALPVFRGWTVDVRLREFRKVSSPIHDGYSLQFIPFNSPAGAVMFRLYQKERN